MGRIDEDGFLFIEGRMSRFSKIGGEMVPHLTVEQKIAEALKSLGVEQEGLVVVVGIPDEKRGESLVALSTVAIEQAELRRKLAELGLPNLWIPKVIRQVAAIPLLATGKLDLRACQRLAREPEEQVVAP
jgi:acyl-[acyl-carrier-protein]-phospholipid O-acyltransferase/long-chain-fatty-acid--[acyl-carrier-protein] ligase